MAYEAFNRPRPPVTPTAHETVNGIRVVRLGEQITPFVPEQFTQVSGCMMSLNATILLETQRTFPSGKPVPKIPFYFDLLAGTTSVGVAGYGLHSVGLADANIPPDPTADIPNPGDTAYIPHQEALDFLKDIVVNMRYGSERTFRGKPRQQDDHFIDLAHGHIVFDTFTYPFIYEVHDLQEIDRQLDRAIASTLTATFTYEPELLRR